MVAAWKAAGFTYNKYLAIAARVVRRSLKEQHRLAAERRGDMELKMAKWENGKQLDSKPLSNPAASHA
ncbi:mitochondrial ATP synthase epsilon chain-domain-containing protein [Tirmania nivea]|nr:mitochondrial ATP synthase epsilon chain-domain-containing protein [Tirmania nivea]